MISKPLTQAIRLALYGLAAAALHAAPAIAQEEGSSAEIGAAASQLEEIVVVGRQRSVATDVLQERIEAEVVADIVSSEQISRVGDSTVSLALRRLPGVTLVGDQYVYIRGLGERYSSTTLNGAYVPSPDLTRNVIPLDLFPAEIVESISIQKGYSPDRPAAFGGGNVDVRTRGIPEGPVFNLQIGSGWNSESSDDGFSYRGGDDDTLGTDDGTRALPADLLAAIGDYQGNISPASIYQALLRDGEFHSFAEAELINRQLATSLYRDLDLQGKSMSPDTSVELSAGNSWYLGSDEQWRFGVLALGDYKNQWRNRERVVRGVLEPELNTFVTQRTTNQVVLTGSLGFGLEWADEHKLEATAIYLRNTEDEASLSTGNNFNFQAAAGQQLRNYRIRFEERDLEVLQVGGSHRLGSQTLGVLDSLALGGLGFLEDLRFDWYYSDATATTDLPTEVQFSAVDAIDPATGALLATSIRPSLSAADYRFTDLEDQVESYGSALTLPVEGERYTLELSGGYDYYQKARSYLQTQFGLGTTVAGNALSGTPGSVFADGNILDPANGFQLTLGGLGTESYLAAETITAGWGKVDFLWDDTWRVTAGARWEDFERISVPIDQYQFDPSIGKILVPPGGLESLATAEDDIYPAVALTWIKPDFWAEEFQLRFGWSETVARPDLREISGSTYIDPLTEARVRGNPSLLNADISNLDLRGEWYFGNGNNLTVSLFYKDITNPIESVEASGSDDNVSLTFINAESAEVQGLEIEGLMGLGFLSGNGWSEGFFLSGNLTLSDSEIIIGGSALNLTNNTRRMTQQSEYVANLQLGYDSPGGGHSVSLAYSVYGERIYFAGRDGADDAYEQPFDSLDLIWSWYPTERLSLKLRLQNLLDSNLEIEQQGVTILEQTVGLTAKLDLSWKF